MRTILLYPILLLGVHTLAQTVDVQYQAWLRYQPRWVLNEQWSLKSDIDERVYVFPFRQHQYIFRVQAEYDLGEHWKGSAGGSFFQQYLPQDPDVAVTGTIAEVRPELESNSKYKLTDKWTWQQRFRSDFRFFDGEDGFAYSHTRLRYMTGMKYRISDPFALTIWDEILVNGMAVNEVNFFDQNRIGASLQWKWTNKLAWDLTYFNWYQLRSTPGTYYNRHIVRLALQHQFGQ